MPDDTYLTTVRSYDHTALSRLPAYRALRAALNDLATQSEQTDLTLADWLAAAQDMAITTPYGDMCKECRDRCVRTNKDRGRGGLCPCDAYATYWPHAAVRQGDRIRGTYTCAQGHTWTCGWAVDLPAWLA
ncbi:hypothetical protein AB0C69_10930 [Actinomadura sp. NPDC048032]|uniref:hypothetical protein n=1 Tax=Actinomadura sp. NPDC048032 TaxID=3155747 RepID=UPI0033F735E5